MSARPSPLPCFKAYDIRGRVPDELDASLARRIGRAYARLRSPRRVVVGRDMRPSSDELADALSEGLMEMGVDVVDIGLCGTEMVYFATAHLEGDGVDGGIVVTASHNPSDYNGMKLVGKGSLPISGDSGLFDIETMAVADALEPGPGGGTRQSVAIMDAYVDHLLSFVDVDGLAPLKIVSNPGNGCAGLVVDALAARLPFEIIRVHHEPDGSFPHGVPNPLLAENRAPTVDAVRSHGADLGLAWDGDFDRCFFFDEQGGFIEGYYIVGLLAQAMLARSPGEKIIYEPRLTWNSVEMIEGAGGVPILSKTGHAFIKERMRKENALYGGEMSAHHYFRDFAYCDTGMVPWLLVAELMSRAGSSLSALVGERQKRFPCSGEINRKVADAAATLAAVRAHYEPQGATLDLTDGLSFDFPQWRFNLRMSNTEPVIRLNVETRGDAELLRIKTDEVLAHIGPN